MIMQIEAYNKDDQVLYIRYPENKRYKYFNVSEYHKKKIQYFIKQRWVAKSIAYIKNFKFERIYI